ncbi:hypothetical protein LTR53_018266, partial [Teratosphaeriaceae sp. CCFEE 6253]
MKRPTGLDVIDQLDVTGIYGQGLFHHDGPFDACNPHRNAKTARRPAPMQAFPADSANMALGGSGPVRSQLDLDKFHGRGEEGFADYAVAARKQAPPANPVAAEVIVVNSTDRAEQVHGPETYGLGTSTFLDGAPAGRAALQRRESEDQGFDSERGAGGVLGLARTKSLAQRFRGMSASRRGGGVGGGESLLRSPEARYRNLDGASPPPAHRGPLSGGGMAKAGAYTNEREVNPFENDYEGAFEKKGAEIRVAEEERAAGGQGRRLGGGSSAMGASL